MSTAGAAGVPPLFAELFDDAALFPPGNAAMPDAVRDHAGYRQDWYAGLVARFVCPAGQLAELDAAVAELEASVAELDAAPAGSGAAPAGSGAAPAGSGAAPDEAAAAPEGAAAPDRGAAVPENFEVSLTVPGGPADLAAALAAAEDCRRLRIGAVELPVGSAGLSAVLAELAEVADRGIAVYAEVPADEVSAELAGSLRAAGLGLKLRTGGTAAAAFPSAALLAGAIEAAVAGGVRFKCTAGLHNAVGHDDPSTGWAYHGFLNVLLAVHSAQAGGRPPAELLADRDAAALAEQAGLLSATEVAAVRAAFASIGSCSISEPLTDLIDLKLVSNV